MLPITLIYNLNMKPKLEFVPPGRTYGKFSPWPEQIKRIRKEAEDRGEDPDAAEAAHKKKIDDANERLADTRLKQ